MPAESISFWHRMCREKFLHVKKEGMGMRLALELLPQGLLAIGHTINKLTSDLAIGAKPKLRLGMRLNFNHHYSLS